MTGEIPRGTYCAQDKARERTIVLVLSLFVLGLGLVALSLAQAAPASAASGCEGTGAIYASINGTTACVNGGGTTGTYRPPSSGGCPWSYLTSDDRSTSWQDCIGNVITYIDPTKATANERFLIENSPGKMFCTYNYCSTWVRPSERLPLECVVHQYALFHPVGSQDWRPVTRGDPSTRPDSYGNGCLSTWELTNEFTCGEMEVQLTTTLANENGSRREYSSRQVIEYSVCTESYTEPLPDVRIEVHPVSATVEIDAPDVIPVGGKARPSTIMGRLSDRICDVVIDESTNDQATPPRTERKSCSLVPYLAPRTTRFDFTLTASPVGIEACKSRSQLGCHYYATPPDRSSGSQSITVYAYRATSPGESIRIDASDSVWSFDWLGSYRGPGTRTWSRGQGPAGWSPWSSIDTYPDRDVYQGGSGSLPATARITTPQRAVIGPLLVPIAGAIPTPVPDRQ